MRQSIIIYRDWWEAFKQMPEQMRHTALEAVMSYGFEQQTPTDAVTLAVTALMRSALDRDNAKYEQRVERNRRNSLKGVEARRVNAAKTAGEPAEAAAEAAEEATEEVAEESTEAEKVEEVEPQEEGTLFAVPKAEGGARRSGAPDWQEFAAEFNAALEQASSQIPRIQSLSAKRKRAVRARIHAHGADAVRRVIANAASSTFLNGGGAKGFVADFNWIFAPDNFLKILEGNYNRPAESSTVRTTPRYTNHGVYQHNIDPNVAAEERRRHMQERILRELTEPDAPAADLSEVY
ncbi:MAG: DUF6291 domain-containing protein [Candidatus Amulumruptor caecigallinarius]|nr:DUF6291 domain-containing protein [Candidatus Amulumruptor caecigallinarius]MCM1397837.1 DUF6291 domain-containing protein [Candidatus Amulumruptor caecigallinarius]MCM1454890.1 DUF6291 domain-containing protein [bacterium]